MAAEPVTQVPQEVRKTQTKRQWLEVMRSQLANERSSFMSHWRDLGENILPRRPRFQTFDVNRGDRRNQKIIDSTGSLAVRDLSSGMMAGISSPSKPWFRLAVSNPALMANENVKRWLHDETVGMVDTFIRSNLYNVLPIIYGDIGTFATGAMLVEEDFQKVVRFYHFPIGSYYISANDRGEIDFFMREFRMTVRNLVKKFGKKDANGEIIWSNFSSYVKQAYDNSQDEAWCEVRHAIFANDEYDENKLSSKFKKYRSIYYEAGYGIGDNNNYTQVFDQDIFLRDSGYDYFPVLAPRWEVNAEDSYGNNCPGIMALGDIKALQLLHKRKAQAIEKKVNPPMKGPTSLKTVKTSILPGDITFTDEREGQKGFSPIHEVNLQLKEVLEDIMQHQDRIRRCYFTDLFRLFIDDPRSTPPTAEEIKEKAGEKLTSLGPVLEQLNGDLFDKLIDITFAMRLRQGLVSPPPQELAGQPLHVEYISIMAQAQKLIGISGMERLIGGVSSVAGIDPSAGDKLNADAWVDEYADTLGVNPKLVRTDDEVKQIRQARAQAAQQKAQTEMIASNAKAAADLSAAKTGDDNALTAVLDQAKAGSLVPQ